jgi:hypothetical protein
MGDMFSSFLEHTIKQALGKGLQTGGVTVIEEFAEQLTVDQLSKFIEILKRIHDKKKNVIHVR